MTGERLPEEERREAILEGAFRVAVRDGLRDLNMRAVAEAAGVSKGLVFFHFHNKKRLLLALLDWMLVRGPHVEVPGSVAEDAESHPARRLLDLVEHQVVGLRDRRERVALFLDFWVVGTRMPETQERIRGAFDRYRSEFLPYTEPVIEALPEQFEGTDAEELAAVIVSFIEGCALQFMSDPDGFDMDRYMTAVRGLVGTG